MDSNELICLILISIIYTKHACISHSASATQLSLGRNLIFNKFAILKDANIDVASGSCESTATMVAALCPLALVHCAIDAGELAFAVLAAILPLALVNTTVGPVEDADTMVLAVDPGTLVFGSVI